MQQIFEGWLIASDIDGTLLYDFDQCPQSNVDAILRFQELGGRFTLATGRHSASLPWLIDLLQIKTPLILNNGGGIYDVDQNTYLYNKFLPDTALGYLKLFQTFPTLSEIRIMTEQDEVYSVYRRSDVDPDADGYARYDVKQAELTDVAQFRWRKVLLITSIEEAADFRAKVQEENFPDVTFVASSRHYYEMVARGVNKGDGLLRLSELLGVDRRCTVGIGDYDNDLTLVRAAGIGACPQNAQEAIKREADVVVKACREGALAGLIDFLERKLMY